MSLFPFRAEHLPEINARLSRRPSLAEAFALLLGVGFTLAMMVLSTNWGTFVTSADFSVFLSAVHGEYRGFFYAYWSLYLFAPFTLLNNILLAYLLWNIINLAGVWFAARVFNGRPALALLSYQMLFSLYYGQIVGVIVAGIALTYLGLLRRSWLLTGVGIALACIKPQMGVSAVLVLVLVANIPWRERLLAFLVPGLLLVVTLLQYGGWPLDIMIRISSQPPAYTGSIALWDYIGSFSLLLWIPVVWLRIPKEKRLIAAVAASSLAFPYYQHTGLILLLVLPIGWFGLLGNLGYLMVSYSWAGLETVILLPLVVYMWSIWSGIQDFRARRLAIHSRGAGTP